jgi:hypothetical protein
MILLIESIYSELLILDNLRTRLKVDNRSMTLGKLLKTIIIHFFQE